MSDYEGWYAQGLEAIECPDCNQVIDVSGIRMNLDAVLDVIDRHLAACMTCMTDGLVPR